jgi:hypothetical protein
LTLETSSITNLGTSFFANKTISDGYVTFNDNIKEHNFTEAGVSVTAQLYTGSALANLGSLNVTDRLISPIKLTNKLSLQEALRNSRFNTTMKGGAWEIVLNLVQQFLQWLVQQYHKMLKTFSGVVLLLLQKLLLLLWFRVLDKVLSLLLHKLLLLLWLLDKLMVFLQSSL